MKYARTLHFLVFISLQESQPLRLALYYIPKILNIPVPDGLIGSIVQNADLSLK